MTVGVDTDIETRRRAWRPRVIPIIEFAVVAAAIAMGVVTYIVIRANSSSQQLLSPGVAALLLLGDLLPVVALLVLVGRRIAKRRAARANVAGDGRLHARLVAIFSLIASVPIVLTVIAASIMFQSVNQFWVSSSAEKTFDSTIALVTDARNQFIRRWVREAKAQAYDISNNRDLYPIGSEKGHAYFIKQTFARNLYQAVLFSTADKESLNIVDVCDLEEVCSWPGKQVFSQRVTPQVVNYVSKQGKSWINRTPDTIWVVTQVPDMDNLFLYVGTSVDAPFLARQHLAAADLRKDYQGLILRSRALQLKFNAALFLVAVLIIGLTVWIALTVADRLVRPINELVGAARQVAEGDLSVRVAEPASRDEVGTLGDAFNSMTSRLQEQTNALISANSQLDRRRALIEAVVSGVSAGVISIGADRTIQLANESAAALLNAGGGDPVGQPLHAISPELDALLDSDTSEAIIQIAPDGDPKTLAVKITSDADGRVLTFDDITQQLLDQRRAAWSDVARRIAHEIKNPLTPIQLAAERLQRRYGKQIDATDGTFNRLTDTIVRQVGDLRRMVDEFSSFARMPKPVFRDEQLVDIVRQQVFLQEVAHTGIDFSVEHDEPAPHLVCDRRQLAQALTNIVKNAVEAVEAREDREGPGEIKVCIRDNPDENEVMVEVADNGIGLPVERDRIVEPYMTTRARGTGLGLAIVKKIVEEHFGTISFSDRPEGGTLVRLVFDTSLLAGLSDAGERGDAPGDERPAALTRNRSGSI
ncbi:sensor histidine kinase NtrY-like [Stakelama marina]|uniref:histidine kinase n=1 Tax=Stakelama marina TaxID=2826939 RepID=A0A8T4IEY5_9SPHN|nr:ATP-binding protein [Stakelama marina]MBR0551595.1 HAMP domain-containing protein [Stakelama marina]